MDRRQFAGFAFSTAAAGLGCIVSTQTARSQEPSLKDTLEKGLKARRPSEFQFIKTVVDMVNAKKLPADMVLAVFHYVRKKKRFKTGLVPYFAAALRQEAAKKGIKIP